MAINYFANKPMPTMPNPFIDQEQSAAKKEQGLGWDMWDSATAGLFDSVGGVLDLVGAKGFAKDFYGWAEENRQEMSDEGRAAIGKSIFEKNESGEWSFGEGASDLDTWLLGFANMAGQFATSVVPGAGAGALAAKAGLAAKGVNAARIAGYAAGGGSAATGMAMEEGRQEVLAMPDDVLMKSDRFADAVRQTYKPDMSDDEAFDTAKAFLADQVAQEIRTDPKVLLANYGASAIGDPIIGRALAGARIAKGKLRSIGKGFVTEGTTEAVQAGTTQYSVNEALQPIDGRDTWDGVDVAAANEGIMGGVFGGAAVGIGGVWSRQPEPVKDPDADTIRESNPVLALGFDGIAQSSADRQADLDNIINQPALEGELLGPEPAPSEPLMITDKNIIFAGDGRPQQAAQEFTDNLQRQAAQAASVPRLPQKDIIFAGDQSGVRVKGNGEVYQSPREAMTSKQARAMKRSGVAVEAVQFGDGWGWRVKEGDSLLQTSTAPGATSEDGGPQTSETLGLNLQQTSPMLAGDVDQINQPQPVQFKKSGEPFKAEKEMKMSASYKAASAGGVELETVKVDGGFGFRVKAAPMEVKVAPGGLSEGHDSTQPTSSEPTPTRLGDGAEAPNTITEPVGAAQTENSNVSLAAPVGASQPETIDTELGTSADVTLPAVEAGASVAQSELVGTYSHARHSEVTVEVAKTPKGFSVDWGDGDVQEFKGATAADKLKAALTREQYQKQNSALKFSKTTDDGEAIGEISLETSQKIGRQAGAIRIRTGNDNYGLQHIESRRGDDIREFGYSVEQFVREVATKYNRIYKGKAGHIILAKENGKDQIMFIRLEPSENGDFYDVKTAYLAEKRTIKNRVEKGEIELLWQGAEIPASESSFSPDLTPRAGIEAGPAELSVSHRESSSSESIAENSTTEQPLQPDSKKPEQVRLIGPQLPLSGSPTQVSSETVQSDAETDNPDIQFAQQNTIKAKPAKGINIKLARQLADSIMSRLNGAAGIKVVILETQAEAEKLWQMSLAGELVRGAYNRATNTAYVIAENIRSTTELRTTIAHEVLGHGGLKTVIKPADYAEFIERLKRTRNNKAFEKQWTKIDNDYDGFSEDDKAEEIFAYFVQEQPLSGPVKFWWNALKRFLHKALRSVGLVPAGDPDVEAMQDMLESIRIGFAVGRAPLTPTDRSSTLFLSDSLLQDIRKKYEGTGLEQWWQDEFETGFDKLTESEGRYILNAKDADTVRNSVAASRQEASPSKSQIDTGDDADPENLAFSKSRTTEQADALDKLGLGEEAAETVVEQAKRRANETVDTLKSSSFWKRLNEGIFDGLAGIKQAEEAAGITDPNKQGYVSARLASGLSDILHGVFHYGAPEWRDGVVQRKADTKGLLEVFGMLGDDLNDWLAWMGANRAERLMAEGRENNLSQADIDELKAMAAGKEALFEQVRQEYNKINSAIIDLAEEAGLISAEQRSGFDEEWYVPFFRDMEVDPEMAGIASMVHGPRSRKGIAGQSAQIKELKGGRQSTKDLLENIIQRQSTLIDAAIKNKAMTEIVANLDGTPFMQAVDSPEVAALTPSELNARQKVKVMRNGKFEIYTVTDPALLRGLLQIHTIGNQSLFNRMARSAKRFLTAGITLSPDFIVKNFVRDAAHAWMINKDGFRFGADSVKGLRKAFAEDESYRDLIFSGSAFQGGYVHGADPEAAAQQVRRALRSKGLGEAEIESYMGSLITKGGELLEAYRTASDKVENANRLSTYEAALAAGKSRRQAAYEAKDLMDYSLKGNFGLIGTMIDMLPFFNARLQGMSKLVRAMKAGDGDRVLKVLSANLSMKGLKVAAFSLALAALNDDDERYQELPDWDKDANWHFFIGDQHFRIPKPFELGILFGTMPERMFHYAAGNQPGSDLGKSAAHAVWNTLALNPIPQLALPIVEVMTNKSFFKGSQIEGMGDAQRQPEDRYNAYTSETAKQIGALFGASPKMVEHLILGYSGTLGGYVLSMSDIVARQMLGIEAADAPISRYPVIKAFYQGDAPKTATKFQDEFYKALEESTEAYGSYKRAVEEGDVVRQQELKESESQALGARVALSRTQRRLSELNKQAEMVNNNQQITGAEKRRQLDEITRKKNALYQGAYVRYKLGEW